MRSALCLLGSVCPNTECNYGIFVPYIKNIFLSIYSDYFIWLVKSKHYFLKMALSFFTGKYTMFTQSIGTNRPEQTVQILRPEQTVQILRPEQTVQILRPELTVQILRPEQTAQILRQTVLLQLRCHRMLHLNRVLTICLPLIQQFWLLSTN